MSVDKLKTEYFSHAKHLSERRIEKAKELSSFSTQWLKKLSMGNFVFDTTVTERPLRDPLEQTKFFFLFLNIEEPVSKKLIKVLRVENYRG